VIGGRRDGKPFDGTPVPSKFLIRLWRPTGTRITQLAITVACLRGLTVRASNLTMPNVSMRPAAGSAVKTNGGARTIGDVRSRRPQLGSMRWPSNVVTVITVTATGLGRRRLGSCEPLGKGQTPDRVD